MDLGPSAPAQGSCVSAGWCGLGVPTGSLVGWGCPGCASVLKGYGSVLPRLCQSAGGQRVLRAPWGCRGAGLGDRRLTQLGEEDMNPAVRVSQAVQGDSLPWEHRRLVLSVLCAALTWGFWLCPHPSPCLL